MIWCSGSSPTPYSTSCWRTDPHPLRQGAPPTLTGSRSHRFRRAGPRLLLRAQRRRPGLRPEDLLRARTVGDRCAGRVHRRRSHGHPAPAHTGLPLGRALLRGHPPVADLRDRRAHHGRHLGPGLVGALVGVERAHAGLLPDHHAAVRHLSAAALLDRGPRAPVALRLGVRDHGRSLRAAELRRGAAGAGLHTSPRARRDRGPPAGLDAAHVLRRAGRHDPAVPDPVEVRDGIQERLRAAARAEAKARRGRRRVRGRARRPQRRPRAPGGHGALVLMPAVPLGEAGRYVAAAYIVFFALVLIYVAIMSIKLSRMERELAELNELADRRVANTSASPSPPRAPEETTR